MVEEVATTYIDLETFEQLKAEMAAFKNDMETKV